MNRSRAAVVGLLAALATSLPLTRPLAQEVAPVHGMAMHGDPKYGPDFNHFDYVNPDAPKGGEIRLQATGTFDSFNPFIVRGTPAAGSGSIYDTLLTSSLDEPFTEYGLLAESMEVPEDRSWVIFTLRPQARWHDGKPVTVDDVVFSFETLREKGDPFYRAYYGSVDKVEIVAERKVKFTFKATMNRELPLIMGQLPILPKHYWEAEGRSFEEPTLTPPLGSGPYKIDRFEPGRWITLRLVEDYWGKDLPVNVGTNNWEVIRYDYYRDTTVAFEAFKAGGFDFRQENTAKTWATGYDIPPVKDGRIVKEEIPNELPSGMQGFVFNIRKPMFQDRKVREALSYVFDFEWSNKALFNGLYTRTKSYFDNTELASSGLPAGEELEILERYRGRIPDEVFTTEFAPPVTDGSGNNRESLRKAEKLLREAGWVVKDGKRIHEQSGQVMAFEVLEVNPAFERITQPFVQGLARLGVTATIRMVDSAQYQNRVESFDYDMIVDVFGQSLSPGNEQRDFWGSAAADTQGSRNTIGVKDPVIDELIELVIQAPDRESLVQRTRALDRVLLWSHFVVPHWHKREFWIAYWNKFSHPEVTPKYGLSINSWWYDEEKVAKLKQATN